MLNYQYETGIIRKSCFRYIIPSMIGMLFAQIAPVVDGICVSNGMGEVALSVLSTAAPTSYLFNIIACLGGIGCGITISKCSGSGDRDVAGRVFTRSLIAMITTILIFSILGIVFIEPLLKLLCATPENFEYAKEYLTVLFAGSVFIVLNFAGDYILMDDNNVKLAVTGDIIGAIVNVIVDYIGIFILQKGVWVTAFGTVFGSFCCCLVYLLHFRKKDRLCRIVSPKRNPRDPSILAVMKPGSPEAVMYFLVAVQMLVQNFVLRESAGTMGLGNSAVIENLQLIVYIVIAGTTDTIMTLASAYFGEQNRCGQGLVKRVLFRIGFIMLTPIALVLLIFPQIAMLPYSITDPLMIRTLPRAIRLITIFLLMNFLTTLLMDYLSAVEEEKKANIVSILKSLVCISATLLLEKVLPYDAPWISMIIAEGASMIYLFFFCNNIGRGLFREYPENVLFLDGGRLGEQSVRKWLKETETILSLREQRTVQEKMLSPLLAAIPDGTAPESTFTVLVRDDDSRAVILRYESKKDYLGDLPEDEDDEIKVGECRRSEFIGCRRLMMIVR